jgi:hypothetical protein
MNSLRNCAFDLAAQQGYDLKDYINGAFVANWCAFKPGALPAEQSSRRVLVALCFGCPRACKLGFRRKNLLKNGILPVFCRENKWLARRASHALVN